MHASGRRRKNHIPSLVGPTGAVTDHDGKAQILLQHFKRLMGAGVPTGVDLNWDALDLPSSDLSHLESPFSLTELKDAVDNLHGEKAPGPDGFVGNFY